MPGSAGIRMHLHVHLREQGVKGVRCEPLSLFSVSFSLSLSLSLSLCISISAGRERERDRERCPLPKGMCTATSSSDETEIATQLALRREGAGHLHAYYSPLRGCGDDRCHFSSSLGGGEMTTSTFLNSFQGVRRWPPSFLL